MLIPFFSDLDNTLMYSHRVRLSGECVVVEYLDARIQSYMTKKAFDFFSDTGTIFLIPLTTRTQEQYARLSGIFAQCRYALVCNGGVLLDHGRTDPKWLEETRWLAQKELPAFREAEACLRRMVSEQNIHRASGIMIYARTVDPEQITLALENVLHGSGLNIFHDGRKVYCIPQSVNKGTALKRFMERKGLSWAVAAGDSALDLPMLEAANMAIAPESLSKRFEHRRKSVWAGGQYFSDFICDELTQLL